MTNDVDTLVRRLSARLVRRRLMCAAAESCTGGWIAQVMTAVAGSSIWFDCGFVTYSNHAKTRMLGVDPDLIERRGAVSEEVARAMAAGAIEHSEARVAVAVTGIAGPDGGTAEKPVGTVAFGWITPEMNEPVSEWQRFPGDREEVRWATVVHAIRGLNDRLHE